MSLYATLEPLIVGALVIVSVLVIIKKQAPGLWRKLTGSSKPASSCGGCSGCADSKADDKPKPVRIFRKHSRTS
jgi:hypothetical protein